MDNTKAPFKKPNQKTKAPCSDEKDQESALLQALGNLEKRLDWVIELLSAQDSELEDGEESLDDEESLST